MRKHLHPPRMPQSMCSTGLILTALIALSGCVSPDSRAPQAPPETRNQNQATTGRPVQTLTPKPNPTYIDPDGKANPACQAKAKACDRGWALIRVRVAYDDLLGVWSGKGVVRNVSATETTSVFRLQAFNKRMELIGVLDAGGVNIPRGEEDQLIFNTGDQLTGLRYLKLKVGL